jgi:regulator of replication initiation timing
VKKIEEEHQLALEDLRRRLAAETEEALKDQDDRLGKILGKLQVTKHLNQLNKSGFTLKSRLDSMPGIRIILLVFKMLRSE